MSGEKDLEQLKREAVEKAKAAALAKKQAKAAGETAPKQEEKPVQADQSNDNQDDAKKKAAAAAKAKAAAAAKAKAAAGAAPAEDSADDADLAKKKAVAAAKAKAAALAKAKAAGAGEAEPAGDDAKAKAVAAAKAKAAAAAAAKAAGGGDDDKAKAIAAAKAKAAAAKAAAAGKADKEAAPVEPEKPSPNQPYLDKYVKVITENLGADVLEDSYINKLSKDVPTLVAKPDTYFKLAQFLKYNELLGFDYLSELHGTDFETHMEIYVHLFSYKNRQSVALKVKIDRNNPTIESVQSVWAGANWPECEAYDLLGIKFTGHPDLHRILLGEDWVGYPLRKDYKPYDVEV